MVSLVEDLKLALDRVSFARALGLEPDPWQEDLLRSTSDRVLLNCCRQSGKSTIAAIIALYRALYHPGSLILCLAPALRQSQEVFGKVLSFYRDLGRPIPAQAERKLTAVCVSIDPPVWVPVLSETAERFESPGALQANPLQPEGSTFTNAAVSLELENDSRIVTLPGTEKTIRGFSGAALLIVDEASHVADELYFAVRPMLAVSGGALIMLTTPYGKRGVFFQEWTSGRGWERYEVKAEECPRIPPEFLEEEREALPSPGLGLNLIRIVLPRLPRQRRTA